MATDRYDRTDHSRDWPEYSSYANKCVDCGHYFGGPKRAPVCWPCKEKNETEWNALTPEEQKLRMATAWKEVQEFLAAKNLKITDTQNG